MTRCFCVSRQRGRRLDVEDGDHPRLGLLRVLAAGAARARVLQLDLRQREDDRARDANRLAGHGRDSARRGRCPARLRRADAGCGSGRAPAARGRAPAPLRHERDDALEGRSSRPACRRWGSSSTWRRCRRPPTRRSRRSAAGASSRSSCTRWSATSRARDRRRQRRRRPDRRRGRLARDEPRLLVHEPRARVRRARAGRRPVLPPPQPLVADAARAAARLRLLRRRARVRGADGGDRARQAERRVLRRRLPARSTPSRR